MASSDSESSAEPSSATSIDESAHFCLMQKYQAQVCHESRHPLKSWCVAILNKACANDKRGVALRLPRNCPHGDYLYLPQIEWTDTDVANYHYDTSLPLRRLDLITEAQFEHESRGIWVFDAGRCKKDELPEIALDETRDLSTRPSTFLFYMGQCVVKVIASEHLELVPTRARFALKGSYAEENGLEGCLLT